MFEVHTIIKDTNNEYHSNKKYIGSTSLKLYGQSPAHYKASIDEIKKQTEAMIFGSAYHTFVLEPELFSSQYFVLNESERPVKDKDFRNSDNKNWKEKMLSENANKQIISLDDYEIMNKMLNVLNISGNKKYLQSDTEMSYYVKLNGVNVKIRPDSYFKGLFISDLKTCESASPDKFKKHALNMGYHISAALYSDVLNLINGKREPFYFIAQEKTPPYAVTCFIASEQFIAQGRHEYEIYLERHKKCLETGIYPGYEIASEMPDGKFILDLPIYGLKEILI